MVINKLPRFLQNIILSKFRMQVKKETRVLSLKKLYCSLHDKILKFKCQDENCDNPFICNETDCLDIHFQHSDVLSISKFNSIGIQSKFTQVQKCMQNDALVLKANFLKKKIQGMHQSINEIFSDFSQLNDSSIYLKQTEEQRINETFINKLDDYLSIGGNIQQKIEKLRLTILDHEEEKDLEISSEKNNEQANLRPNFLIKDIEKNIPASQINENPHQQEKSFTQSLSQSSDRKISQKEIKHVECRKNQEFHKKVQLISFLRKHILDFSWKNSKEIFNKQSKISQKCERFHKLLEGKANLLFVFIGQKMIIGSFFVIKYPNIQEKTRKDNQSFIFVADEEQEEGFVKFVADPTSEYHINVTQKLLVCHGNTPTLGDGLRTFQKNFEVLHYFLPSRSFFDLENRSKQFYGTLNIKDFFILQIGKKGNVTYE